MTGQNGPDIQRMTMDAGFDSYMNKPADTALLLVLVDDLGHRDRQPEQG